METLVMKKRKVVLLEDVDDDDAVVQVKKQARLMMDVAAIPKPWPKKKKTEEEKAAARERRLQKKIKGDFISAPPSGVIPRFIAQPCQYMIPNVVPPDAAFYQNYRASDGFPTTQRYPDHLKDVVASYYTHAIVASEKRSKEFIKIGTQDSLTVEEGQRSAFHAKNTTSADLNQIALRHLAGKMRGSKILSNFSHIEAMILLSKKHNIVTVAERNVMDSETKEVRTENVNINIYESHKEHEKLHRKSNFDPYARQPKILIEYHDAAGEVLASLPEEDRELITTDTHGYIFWNKKFCVGLRIIGGRHFVYLVTSIAQLAFMAWARNFGVLEWCENPENFAFIKKEIKVYEAEKKVPVVKEPKAKTSTAPKTPRIKAPRTSKSKPKEKKNSVTHARRRFHGMQAPFIRFGD